ncbi:hypothetical protein CPB85DRAFT_1255893 [Mucidula mucida]|nr:hypothetical protein CPB85DRAFT_1255893 [Mucidula mucida]
MDICLPQTASSDAPRAHASSMSRDTSPPTREPLAPSQFPFSFQCPVPPTTLDEKVIAIVQAAARPADSQAIEAAIENEQPVAEPELESVHPPKRQCRRRLPSNQEAFEKWLFQYPEDKTADAKLRVLRKERRWIKAFKFSENKVQCRKCEKYIQLTKGDDTLWSICPWIDHRNYSCTGIFEAFMKARKSGQPWDGSEW